MQLLQWQEQAFQMLGKTKMGDGICLYCDTGLGKGVFGTYVAEKVKKCLILCPPHLISDWKGKLIDNEVNILDKTNLTMIEGINIISINKYLLYHKQINYIANFFLIIDEAHRIKNTKGKTFKSLFHILDKTNGQLLLSATFETKNNTDLFAPAYLTSQEFRNNYKSYWDFCRANVTHKRIYLHKRVIEVPEKIRPKPLQKWISPQFFVATYESAEIRRPKFILKHVEIESSKRLKNKINTYKNKIDEEIVGKIGVANLDAIYYKKLLNVLANPSSKLTQLSNQMVIDIFGKVSWFSIKKKLELVYSLMENKSQKGILFYYYQAELNLFQSTAKIKNNSYFYDRNKDVSQQIEEFENSDTSLFIVNYASLGEGVRFKKTHYMIEFTLIYDYAKVLQARGRLQYVGREDTYTIYHFQLEDEVVKNIINNINSKATSVEENMALLGE